MRLDVGGKNDPIANFGSQVSQYVMTTIQALPPAERKGALKAVFDQIDPKLWSRVASKASALARQHHLNPQVAMERAIASSMSMGLLEEFIRAGKNGTVKPKSMLGLAVYGDDVANEMLAGLGSWYNPLSWINAGTAKVVGAAAPVGAKVGEWGKGVLDQVGNLACSVANSQVGQVAAGAGAAAAGAPPQVGAQGASVVAGMCSSQQPVLPQQKPFPWLPVLAIGGVAVVVLILVLKK